MWKSEAITRKSALGIWQSVFSINYQLSTINFLTINFPPAIYPLRDFFVAFSQNAGFDKRTRYVGTSFFEELDFQDRGFMNQVRIFENQRNQEPPPFHSPGDKTSY